MEAEEMELAKIGTEIKPWKLNDEDKNIVEPSPLGKTLFGVIIFFSRFIFGGGGGGGREKGFFWGPFFSFYLFFFFFFLVFGWGGGGGGGGGHRRLDLATYLLFIEFIFVLLFLKQF